MNVVERTRYLPPSAAEDAANEAQEQRAFHRIAYDRLVDAWKAVEEMDRADRTHLLNDIDRVRQELGYPDDLEGLHGTRSLAPWEVHDA